MLKQILGVVLALALVAVSVPAWAQSISQTGGAGGAGGAATVTSGEGKNSGGNIAIGGSGARGGDAILGGGPGSGESTGGAGGSGGSAGGGSANVSIKTPVQDRIPGLAVAPGLAAAGTGVCLGSFSVGLSGPMAGVAFGKTVVDKGCERRSNSVILYQRGHFEAADYLLRLDPEVQDALDYQHKTGKHAPKAAAVEAPKVSKAMTTEPPQVVSEVMGKAIQQTHARQLDGVQGP